MHNLKRFAVVFLLTFIITWSQTGCSTVISRIHDYRMAYCSKTSDSFTKAFAIGVIRTQMPFYPEEGICVGYEDTWYGEGFYIYPENK